MENIDIYIKPRFQFHYGTIKSKVRLGDDVTHVVFQFHYGTIKSKWLLILKIGKY